MINKDLFDGERKVPSESCSKNRAAIIKACENNCTVF
jgi:hypothetical protein